MRHGESRNLAVPDSLETPLCRLRCQIVTAAYKKRYGLTTKMQALTTGSQSAAIVLRLLAVL